MKKKSLAKLFRSVLAVAILATIIVSLVAVPQAKATTYQAGSITRRDDLQVNYQDYANGSVLFELPDAIKSDDQISVIITVDVPNLMDAYNQGDKTMSFSEYALHSEEAAQLEAEMAAEKARILADLDAKGVEYTLGEDYSRLLAGFEIVIKAENFSTVCMSLGNGESAYISEEYAVAETQLVENTVNMYDTGIFKSDDSGYDGTGMVVAVLDTGIDSNHSAFSVDNFTSTHLGMTYDDVAAVLDQTQAYAMTEGLTVDDVYINEKIPFAYDYADGDSDAYSTHNNHGTHVSGVIVGKDDTITGVAPNAQLVSMKTFSDVMDTARTSWILAALEDCVVLGVDVVNMSLGTSAGFSRESDEEMVSGVYDKLREAGISVVVAASNSYSSAYGSEANGNLPLTSNPDTGTVGSPGTYPGTLSVASIAGEETPYILHNKTIIYFDESNTGAAEENDFCDTLLGDQESIEIEYVIIPGVGRSADYTGMDVTGKIALVRRGDNTFEEKAMIAEEQGAAGIIVYNNVSGEIKMNVGDAKLATCSISQEAGEALVAAGNGKLKISKTQTSGPFISDFSSWGPSPNLEIKPEITAHGGQILSSITGGGYDRMSGTSMACPNIAGVVILLRQYVVENFPEIADDPVAVNQMVNRLMMSTADIALNTNGLPYAVRKQGAGLANLMNAINTPAYIKTYAKDGSVMDKTKLELGDDKEKTGVYTMSFSIVNFGDETLTYELGAHVFTEGVSDIKTNAGKTTVTEEAYALEAGFTVDSVDGGTLKDQKVTVEAGSEAKVTVTVTLTEEDKAYLDASFENGMYVEGFITLEATKGTDVDMSIPYLAFYGDWTVAPLFDLTYYDTNADELNQGLNEEDKLKADAYASRPIGGVEDDYVAYMGSYYWIQDEGDIPISANPDYISLSNQVGTVHALRYVWAGMLRGAENVVVTITDDTTGEEIFRAEDDLVRKSYGDGGSLYPAQIEIEFDTINRNLTNNSQYTVEVVGYLDYEDGGINTNKNNTYTFPLYIDFEAPAVTDVQFRYEYDKTLKKNRLYADVYIYDNHYTMSAQLGYVGQGTDEDGNSTPQLYNFEHYMTPVYSQRNSTTMVTYELTDYIYELKANSLHANTFVVSCYDYALNYNTYEIELPDNYVDFYFDGLEEGVTLSPNEVYSLEPLVYPSDTWAELLEFTSSKPSVVRVVNNKLVATGTGKANIKVRDPQTNQSVTFQVTVLAEGDEGYQRFDKPVADTFTLTGYTTQKAYYQVDSNDKDIGDTGAIRFFEGNFNLAMYPSEAVTLNYRLDAYFPADTTVEFESSNENIVTIDANGTVVAQEEGYASVTVKVMMDGKSTYYSETVSVEVKDPYIVSGPYLTHYFGKGGTVIIPDRLHLTEISSFAFANFDYVMKTEEELAFDDATTSKQWYIGENTITKVIIPEGVEKIGAYAFANLTALEEVVLPSTLNSIEYGAFYGCTSLKKVTFSGENNLQIINQNAFENCALEGTIDLSAACVISNYAFAGNTKLEGIITSEELISVGEYAFASCKKLKDVTIPSERVKYGAYAFYDCESLEHFEVKSAVLPEGMFLNCENLKSVVIGADVNDIGPFAFRETKIATFEIEEGNKAYKVQNANYIISADGATLIAVAPTISGEFTAANIGGAKVTTIGKGAFSHNLKLKSVTLPSVTVVADYGFGQCKYLESVTLGKLTDVGEYAFFETSISQLPALNKDMKIGRYAFAKTNVTEVVVPDGMVLPEGIFAQSNALTTVTIGNNVTVGKYAFNMDKNEIFTVVSFVDEATGTKYFSYELSSNLQNLTIGNNVKLEDNAFTGHASLETVTLGEGAEIGYMAFYNCTKLQNIDLSKAKTIGDYAFSGDVYYTCMDSEMSIAAISPEGQYMYTYHGPALVSVDLASAESIGESAFAYCRALTDVNLGSSITEISPFTFAGCVSLQNINTAKITAVGDYAFRENEALVAVDLSAATQIGEYAFVNSTLLSDVVLNPEGVVLSEGSFAYCPALAAPVNLNAVTQVGDYAFAYTAITEADLSAATYIGYNAFLKEELTPFAVTLGSGLQTLEDNPFAMCALEPFSITQTETFNGVEYSEQIYTYDISDTVHVIDGSLYCDTVNGMELITYAGVDHRDVQIPFGTVRITALAFAGSDVQRVTMPYTTTSLGHKAFFGCDDLEYVVFGSYNAPILEAEFDMAHYDYYEYIPGTGEYGSYYDYDGNEVIITGTGMLPYYMWNATDGQYTCIFYGANFMDYAGSVDQKITMVKPINGVGYDSFMMEQYFDTAVDGAAAPDDVTLAAIAAIDAIPDKVTYEQKHLVEAARAAYNKVATLEQQSLVTNYADLISAEQRIAALDPNAQQEPVVEEEKLSLTAILLIVGGSIVALVIAGLAVALGLANSSKKKLQAQLNGEEIPTKEQKREARKAAKAAKKAAAEEIPEEGTEEETDVPEEMTEEAEEISADEETEE